MGNLCIPKKLDTENDIDNVQVNVPQQEKYTVDDPDEYDRLAVEVLKSEFKDDPETFILNQVLMCYMFFEDFTEEVRVLHHATSQRAQQLNSKLIQDQKKQFFMPDSIFEVVNKRVKFEYSNGPKKGALEPLASQRLYIIHDNVEVIDEMDGYTSIDKPHYRANVKESKDSAGFLKVNIFESIANDYNEYKRSSGDSENSAESTKYKRRKSILTPIFAPNGDSSDVAKTDSGVSTADNSEPEYEYSRITAAQTPKIIDITKDDAYTNIHQFPISCIVKTKEKNFDSDEDNEDLFNYKYYLNSTEFMKYFQNTVFPNHIGELLGFSKSCIQDAKSIPGSMFCHRKDYNNAFWEFGDFLDSMIEFEIIPAISTPRLHSSAFEWVLRERPNVLVFKRLKPICYTWPTQKMLQEAKAFHSIIVPKGFMPKKKENPQMHLEWEVQFPKIEKYLEFRMSHAQTRVFLFLIVLFKKFIEPLTQKHGLSVEHLRFVMFWECEANYKDWLEDKLGKKIAAVLKNLYGYLAKSCLPHYFIKNKNVFENVPRKYLIANQEIIHNILESPVSYALTALKDLKYYSDKFYPLPNIEELVNILTLENVLSNIPISTQETVLQKQQREYNMRRNKDSKLDREQLWFKKFVEMQRNKAQSEQELEEQRKKNLESDCPELSLDVNINFKKKLCKTETARQRLVFIYFIKQHIEIAQRSLKISSTTQTMFYLKQAFYLTKLLDEIASESLNVKDYQSQITSIEKKCMKKMVEETNVPLTPKRNSSTIMFHSDILQVKGKDINMSKLNMSYNSTMFAKQGKPTKSTNINRRSTLKRNLSESVENGPVIVDEAADNDNSRMTGSNGKDDVNSITSDLENNNSENIEVIADVHNETPTENQSTSILKNNNEDMDDVINELEHIIDTENQKYDNDIVVLNHLKSVSEVHNVTAMENDVNKENISLTDLENDATVNNIPNDSESEIEVENQKKEDDIVSLSNIFDLDNQMKNTENEENNDTDNFTCLKSMPDETTLTNEKEDTVSTSNDSERSNVENIEEVADVENPKTDDLNGSKNNSETTTNDDINDSNKDLEKPTVENDALAGEKHTVPTTENEANDDDKNSLNDSKNNPEIYLSQNGDVSETPNSLKKPTLENGEVDLDENKIIPKKSQKNNDSSSLNKLSNFRIGTYEERNKF